MEGCLQKGLRQRKSAFSMILRRSAARNMRRARVAEATIMKIAGWKTANMFRRYDIQDGRDIKRAAESWSPG